MIADSIPRFAEPGYRDMVDELKGMIDELDTELADVVSEKDDYRAIVRALLADLRRVPCWMPTDELAGELEAYGFMEGEWS